METIGKRIAKYRKEKGLTQEGLAEKLDVSAQAVSKWENDASCPDICLLPQLCKELGITTDELLTGKNEKVQVLPENQRKPLEELVFRVRINSADGDRIRVNFPMTLVKLCMEIGVDVIPNMTSDNAEKIRNIDMKKILQMVEMGLIGKLVEIESADGDTIEVVVE